jgi:hypothetical protein
MVFLRIFPLICTVNYRFYFLKLKNIDLVEMFFFFNLYIILEQLNYIYNLWLKNKNKATWEDVLVFAN